MTDREMTDGNMDELLRAQALPALPAERLKQIEAALIADLKPVRPLAPAGVYLSAFAGIFIAACILSWFYFTGQSGWEALSRLQKPLVFVPLLAIMALLIFSVVRQMAPAARYTRTTALLAAGVFLLMLACMTLVFHPIHESAFVHDGLVCFRAGMTFAIPASLLFALLLLRGAALPPALTGATAGGLAGLAGLAVLEIHCPNLDVYHILVWHVSVTVVCAIAGVILASVMFRNRT
jgi:hypothetical protein